MFGVLVSLLSAPNPHAQGDQIHVAPNGQDTNSGGPGAPLRSLTAAASRAGPGTTILVAPGDYPGGFRTAASGTIEAPVSYVSQRPEGARIVGGGRSPDQMAWWNQGSHVRVVGFTIDGRGSAATSWRIGFYNTGSDLTFQGNHVHHILTDNAAFAAASASGMGGAGIEMDNWAGGQGSRVTRNLVDAIGPNGRSSSLVHGIYQIETGLVSDNVIYDVAGCGITLWHGAGNIVIANNTIDDARGGGILVGSGDGGPVSPGVSAGDDVRVARNIIVRSAWGIAEAGKTGRHNVYIGNLLFDNRSSPIRLQNGLSDTGTVQVDPLFVDRDRHDYRLRPGSSAAGVGASGTEFLPP
jgi:hypothetical protein